MDFDFKDWANLYKVDPEAFERRRDAALENFVSSLEDQRRKPLEHTLFRIQMARSRSKSPLQSAMEASKLMWESFGKLREQVDVLEQEMKAPQPLKRNGLRLVGVSGLPQSDGMLNEDEQKCPTPAATALEVPRSAQVFQFKAANKPAH